MSAIKNTNSALEETGNWVDRMNADQPSPGSVQANGRFHGTLPDHRQLPSRKTELMACHQQLSNVLNFLTRLEDLSTAQEPPTYQDPTYYDDIAFKHRRKTAWNVLDTAQTGDCMCIGDSWTHTKLTICSGRQDSKSFPVDASRMLDVPTERPRDTIPIPSSHYYDKLPSQTTLPHSERSSVYPSLPASMAHTPGSPPPTYISAVQSNAGLQYYPQNAMQYLNASALVQKHEQNVMSKMKINTWAYQPSERHETIPELAGDTVCMSGTNSFGPVNPFEYRCIPQPTIPSAPCVREETNSISELLGDISLVPELPGSGPIQPKIHSPRLSRGPSNTSGHGQLANRMRNHTQRMPVRDSEVLAFPPRRPIPPHSVSEPVTTTNELETAFPTLNRQLVFSGTSPLLEGEERHVTHPRWSSASIPTSLRPASGSSASPRQITRSSLGSELSIQSHAPPPSDTTASTRMRRQKHMLDLLGSIGS
jgi:hypothetical protein